jgi:hypothetical protein
MLAASVGMTGFFVGDVCGACFRKRALQPQENGQRALRTSQSKRKKAVIVAWLGLIDSRDAVRLPRSLHYVTRRTQPVRKKKPGHSGRDDNL